MLTRIRPRRLQWKALAVLGLLLSPLWAGGSEPTKEPADCVTVIDFNECDPVQVRSKIMDVHPQKGTMIVAEREIRLMDVMNSGQKLKTSYLDIEGKPALRTAFRAGQYVMVEGFQHPDGYIAASVVRRIDKPAEKNAIHKSLSPSRKSLRKASSKPGLP